MLGFTLRGASYEMLEAGDSLQALERVKGKEASATGWITKPFSPDKLKEIVHKTL